jgi:hypothetical protein
MLLDAVPVEHALVYFSSLARGQVGRSLLEDLSSSDLRIEISGSNLKKLKPSKFWISSEISALSLDPGEESPNTAGQRAR